jgi:lysophospholipase L1-like esterase
LSKLLLLVAATLLAGGLAEGLFRLLAPQEEPRGRFFTANGLEVPLGEIIAFLTRMPEADARHNVRQTPPHGMMLANLKLRLGYAPKPRWDYFDENGCVAVDTNSLGLRDLEFEVKKRPGELRILALGDSLTYGQGVRLDLTWPQVLEARLRREHQGPVEVINAGFAAGPGVNSPDGCDRWVAEHGVLFEPDVVVVGICLNDVGPIGMLTYPAVKAEPVLGGWSTILNRVVQVVRQREARQQKRDLGDLVTDTTPAWLGTTRGLRALRDTLAAKRIPFVVVVFPMMSQLEPELYPCRRIHDKITGFCSAEGIPCVDLLPDFLGRNDEDLWVHSSDQHPNHVGQAVFADRIHAFLATQGLLGAR